MRQHFEATSAWWDRGRLKGERLWKIPRDKERGRQRREHDTKGCVEIFRLIPWLTELTSRVSEGSENKERKSDGTKGREVNWRRGCWSRGHAKGLKGILCGRGEYEEEDLVVDDDNESFFEVVDSGEHQNEQTNLIDAVVGKLEEILVDESFETARMDFCRKNCDIFDHAEENKLEYTVLFRNFSELVEKTLEERLKVEFPQFTVPWFVDMLKDEPCDGDVFDMLFALSDFQEFKEMMVSFKKEKEVESGERSKEMAVCRMRIYSEEQEDGDARPDLDDLASLSITPLAN